MKASDTKTYLFNAHLSVQIAVMVQFQATFLLGSILSFVVKFEAQGLNPHTLAACTHVSLSSWVLMVFFGLTTLLCILRTGIPHPSAQCFGDSSINVEQHSTT